MKLEILLGQKVDLHGTAKDAKSGAVITTPEGYVIYIKGLETWPSEFLNKRILVSGILKEEKLIPDPIIDENGSISTGAIGDQFVLIQAEYSLSL
ncbi:MAG: hypothetical protein ACFFHV_18330 [Promethearchaeota archaeon]